MTKAEFDQQMAALDRELAEIEDTPKRKADLMSVAELLLPRRVLDAISQEGIDTLIVIPVFDLGVIPYAALPIGVKPLIGSMATKSAILKRLRKKPAPPLIYFAAHGVADDANPLDGGFLALSDVRWTGREIVRQTPRNIGRPLVVLSACQTGLGKNFDVGTIGLARAWHEVGASNVVMSLWLVGDRQTKLLMARFVEHALGTPPDKALRQAMLERRREDPRITAWASFAVFGAPEL